MTIEKQVWGLLAYYSTPNKIYKACEKIKSKGFSNWDTCTPFPVHGLEKAMGLKQSFLGWLVLVAGLLGGILGLTFMIWVSVYVYPLNIGGKPTWSIPAFIPVAFETTILFSALTAVFGMLLINKLPMLHHPVFNGKFFKYVTDDLFCVVIEAKDPKFNLEEILTLLKDTQSVYIEKLELSGAEYTPVVL